jgi:hypothetical protein
MRPVAKRSAGITLIEVLVAMSLLTVVMFGTISVMTQQNRARRNAQLAADYAATLRSIEMVIANDGLCSNSIAPLRTNYPAPRGAPPVSLANIRMGDTLIAELSKGKPKAGVRFSKIELHPVPGTSPAIIGLPYNGGAIAVAQHLVTLHIEAEKDESTKGLPLPAKDYPLYVYTLNNLLIGCSTSALSSVPVDMRVPAGH